MNGVDYAIHRCSLTQSARCRFENSIRDALFQLKQRVLVGFGELFTYFSFNGLSQICVTPVFINMCETEIVMNLITFLV